MPKPENKAALTKVLTYHVVPGKLDAAAWQDLREEGQPAFIDHQIPEEPAEQRLWPQLTPAGIRPHIDVERELHRPRV